jgi:hypothetical protein
MFSLFWGWTVVFARRALRQSLPEALISK